MRKTLTDQQVRAIRVDPRPQETIAADYGSIKQQQVSSIKKRTLYASVPDEVDTPEPNSYTGGVDAVAFLNSLPRGLVSGVVTSPPYNRNQDGRISAGHTMVKQLTKQGYADYDDAMPWPDYIAWQREFLSAALDCVGGPRGSGVVVYQHGRTIARHLEQRYDFAILDGFPVRQTIIWDKAGFTNQGGREPGFIGQSFEFVSVIAGDNWRVPIANRNADPLRAGAVWRIKSEQHSPHPAPFPVKLAAAMLLLCPAGGVADPFAGSGTVGIAAHRMGKAYYLGDISVAYQQMFEERLDQETAALPI